jgi:hypothetical protein
VDECKPLEHGCPWGCGTGAVRQMTNHAARMGQLEVLKWLREQGVPRGDMTCAHAARGGYLEVLMWLREYHCPWGSATLFWSNYADNAYEIRQWALAHGCPADGSIFF